MRKSYIIDKPVRIIELDDNEQIRPLCISQSNRSYNYALLTERQVRMSNLCGIIVTGASIAVLAIVLYFYIPWLYHLSQLPKPHYAQSGSINKKQENPSVAEQRRRTKEDDDFLWFNQQSGGKIAPFLPQPFPW